MTELAEALERPVPAVSQHLATLRMTRLVTCRRQGQTVLYRLENGHVRQLVLDIVGQVEHLAAVAVASVTGFLGNEWVARHRIRMGRAIGSAALVADGLHARTDGFTSLAVLVGAVSVRSRAAGPGKGS